MTKRLTILVVDDFPDSRYYLQVLLRADFDVLEAFDVASAIAAIESKHVDLIITDFEMPGAPITSLLAHVSQLPRKVPVIVYSAMDRTEARTRALGADAVISKMAPPDELLAAIKRMTEHHINTDK